MFPYATAPNILRSVQKDEYYIDHLRKQLNAVVIGLVGTRTQMKWNQSIKYLSDILYYMTTTLVEKQTLGEEYSDIVLVHGSRRASFIRRFGVIFLLVFSPLMIRKGFAWAKSRAGMNLFNYRAHAARDDYVYRSD